MYQNIVLSPKVIGYSKNLKRNDLLELFLLLDKESLILDQNKTLLQEYSGIINELTDSGISYELFKSWLTELVLNGKILLKSVHSSKTRNKKELANLDLEKDLALQDIWKIIITDETSELHKLKFKMENEIEVNDIKSYLSPETASESYVRKSSEVIKKNKDDEFNFREWIRKYLLDAGKIEIRDGYCCQRYELSDLSSILKMINPEIPVTITTLRNPEINQEEILNGIQKMYNLTNFKFFIKESKKELRDRMLSTDKYTINLGHSLGAVSPADNRVKREFLISVTLNNLPE